MTLTKELKKLGLNKEEAAQDSFCCHFAIFKLDPAESEKKAKKS